MNLTERQSCVNINMEQVLSEIPVIIERLEDLSKSMDDKFGWKEFKFCFKFATSHIVSRNFSNFESVFINFSSPLRTESSASC